jgi:D-alanyl-lipoteichoic acid acyltransferase DltB (MBOAT superfamily)
MLFNSIDFAIFVPIVFILYWFVSDKHLSLQNFLIVVSSYIFYGWWDWRFLSLLFFSTIVDYSVGLKLKTENRKSMRKVLLWISILLNLGLLGFFKYYNFFLENFKAAFKFFGSEINSNSLNIILPVGISFYTFQTLSYVIDVYNRKLEPTKNFVAFTAYVSFFPQLVAGPIERATYLLPQFYKKRKFDYTSAVDGLRQILWGLFKKVVIADNCAEYANLIFNNSASYSGSTLFLGALFFTFQIYGDFSGYSDIAIGTSRLFGFNLMRNFNFPYFSRNFAEFWRRWHISLSTWFRDYLYIPIGGSRGRKWMTVRNTFIIFIVSGFWHGANWTFIFWGFLNALFVLPLLLAKDKRNQSDLIAKGRNLPGLKDFSSILLTFVLTVFSWIFFRAHDLGHAISYISVILSPSLFTIPVFQGTTEAWITLMLIGIFVSIEWVGREEQYAIAKLGFKWKYPLRYILYYAIITIIFWFGGIEQQFIYFQF